MQQTPHDVGHHRADDVISQDAKHQQSDKRDQHGAEQRLQRFAESNLAKPKHKVANCQPEYDRAEKPRAGLGAEKTFIVRQVTHQKRRGKSGLIGNRPRDVCPHNGDHKGETQIADGFNNPGERRRTFRHIGIGQTELYQHISDGNQNTAANNKRQRGGNASHQVAHHATVLDLLFSQLHAAISGKKL